jgi:hypothetical protein
VCDELECLCYLQEAGKKDGVTEEKIERAGGWSGYSQVVGIEGGWVFESRISRSVWTWKKMAGERGESAAAQRNSSEYVYTAPGPKMLEKQSK